LEVEKTESRTFLTRNAKATKSIEGKRTRRKNGSKSIENSARIQRSAGGGTETNQTKQWGCMGTRGASEGGRLGEKAGPHLGEQVLRLELGVGERPRARAAAPGQRRALALALGRAAHRRGPLERPHGAPLPQHERRGGGQRLLVDGHGGLGGVPPAAAATAAGGGGGAPLRLRRRGRRRARIGHAGDQRAHRADSGEVKSQKSLLSLLRFRRLALAEAEEGGERSSGGGRQAAEQRARQQWQEKGYEKFIVVLVPPFLHKRAPSSGNFVPV